jgi:hypothetical protein
MIYFVRPIGAYGPVKIGIANDVQQRLNILTAQSPLLLEIAAAMEGGKEIECRLHERFISQQSHYEWFHWSPDLQEVIDAINDGSFDAASLPEARGTAPTQRGKKSLWAPERRAWLAKPTNVSRGVFVPVFAAPGSLSADCEPTHPNPRAEE